MSSARIAIVAAGTGGHVMPGLAIAAELSARGWSVEWIGTRVGMERGLVESRGLPFHALDFSNMRGKGLASTFAGMWRLLRSTWDSWKLIRRLRLQAVVSTGGYLSVPVGLAAAILRRPVFFLNADAAPQLSLRLLQPWLCRVFLGFDGEAAQRLGDRAIVSGAPVREEFRQLAGPATRFAQRQGPLRILVAGGSLGAGVLNDVVPQAIARLAPECRPVIVHQCGSGHEASTTAAYLREGVDARVLAFVQDMAAQYAEADLVICRAGAITVSELCVAGVAAILVPLLARTTTHQHANAQWMAMHEAAVHLPQARLNPESLARLIESLNREGLQAMADRARVLGRPDATRVVCNAIDRLVARNVQPEAAAT